MRICLKLWYQFARSCYAQGKMDKAARLFEEASRVRPEDFQGYCPGRKGV